MFRSSLPSSFCLAPLAFVVMFHTGSVQAALSDTIHPYVSLGYTYDDNLLRLPEGYTALEGGGDRITQSQVGILVERPFGRQKLTGSAKISRVTFDRFDQLDYNGKDFNGDLAWQLGNRFSGTLGGVYNETLTPFTDAVTNQRNLRTTRRAYVTGAYRFHPSWQLRSSLTRSKYEYELAAQQVNNRSENVAEFGADYLASSGSRVGLVARRWTGSYDNTRRFGNVVLANDFTQNELKANINWMFSSITQITVLAGYAKREYDVVSSHASGGFNGRASVRWMPTGKLSFNAEAWREFSAVESLIVSSSLNRGASLAATWSATGKIQATASLRRENRQFDFLDSTGEGIDVPDRIRNAQLGLTYSPTLRTQVSLSVFSEKRDGNPMVGNNDYRAKGVSLNASAQF